MSERIDAIKQLREMTGAGVMDCRRALESSDGEVEMAAAALKELGLLQARKRKDRETNEGRVFLKADGRKAVLLVLACETDFVARNAGFIRLGEECIELVFDGRAGTEGLSDRIREAAGRIKENIVVRGLKTLTAKRDELLCTYVHGEGRIGVALSVSEPAMAHGPEFHQMAADLALHIAAFGPLFLSRDSVDAGYRREKEAEFLSDAKALGKPDGMIQRIVQGKMDKHLSRICLMDQGFLREESSSVGEILERLRSGGGPDIQVRDFIYERIGA